MRREIVAQRAREEQLRRELAVAQDKIQEERDRARELSLRYEREVEAVARRGDELRLTEVGEL